MTPEEQFKLAVVAMENALAAALESVVSNTTNPASAEEIARLIKIITKKEIVLEFLLEEILDAGAPA